MGREEFTNISRKCRVLLGARGCGKISRKPRCGGLRRPRKARRRLTGGSIFSRGPYNIKTTETSGYDTSVYGLGRNQRLYRRRREEITAGASPVLGRATNEAHRCMGYKADTHGNDADDEMLCPLCMEVLDETDRNFYPCTCDYQLCLWCLHYIRTTMGNKCPACRRDYEESNMKYKSTPRVQPVARTSNAKKKREAAEKEATTREERASPSSSTSNANANLREMRVIQRNLVYVVGIPSRLARKEILRQHEYFGQYGRIQHMVINKSQAYNSHVGGASYTAYITYSKKSEAALAIQGIDGSHVNGKMLRASYGTTKYCTFFLKGLKCTNVDCFYLHQYGDESERISKEELANLMHKGSKSGFGLAPHMLDNATPKAKEESAKKAPEPSVARKAPIDTQEHYRQEQDRQVFNGYPASSGLTDRDATSWANIAAGVKGAAATSVPMGQYVYQHPEELQMQYSVVGEGYSDGYAHTYDGYRAQRPEPEYQETERSVNSYLTHSNGENVISFGSMNQNEMMRHRLNEPLANDLQRYNRCDHIVYAVDVPLRRQLHNGKYGVQITDAHSAEKDGPNAMHGTMWMAAEEVKASGAYYVANRRRQLDYYKGANQLFSVGGSENLNTGATPTLGPRDLFPERGPVDDILYKLRRHVMMLNSLAKQYSSEPTRRSGAPVSRAEDERSWHYNGESGRDAPPVAGAADPAGAPDASWSVEKAERYSASILTTSPFDESQLEVHLKHYEELATQVQKLAEAQRSREALFARHLSQLDPS
ncbi:CCR4-NOT transcription complex subunit 4, putative [Babesia caballi]|uniref:CCR4-NOT transcription complex subunit 4, putative n=1 Tax=Babesia caballi TaxID=5871 RepID=A0AAV4M1T7_BABCB|nr:CCR4-NOT transcription complex subunit 4, putative [Babesia caballi]